jgi:hypothetical protein
MKVAIILLGLVLFLVTVSVICWFIMSIAYKDYEALILSVFCVLLVLIANSLFIAGVV